jgi:hypothetical protein
VYFRCLLKRGISGEQKVLTFLGEIVTNTEYNQVFSNNENISPENLMKLLYFNYLIENESVSTMGKSLIPVIDDIVAHVREINEIFDKYTREIERWEDVKGILGEIYSDRNTIKEEIERIIEKEI